MQSKIILANLRSKNSLTLNDLAEILNVSLSSYKLYEAGEVPMSLEEINILSKYYDVSFDYLLGLSSCPKRDHFRKSIDYRYLKFCVCFLRKREKISQTKLGKELNYTPRTIGFFEHDGMKICLDYLIKIAKKFQVSTDYLCGKSFIKDIK